MDGITREQAQALDSLAVERGISILALMERAGELVSQLAKQKASGKNIIILCGKGNNGGDGLVSARNLMLAGFQIRVILAQENLGEAAKRNEDALRLLGGRIDPWRDDVAFSADLIIDALLGFNLKGAPTEPYAGIIRAANDSGVPILAVDIPSGLDADAGSLYQPIIRASWTLALSAVKQGCLVQDSKPFVGELYLADIGIPKEIYNNIKIKKPAFAGIRLYE